MYYGQMYEVYVRIEVRVEIAVRVRVGIWVRIAVAVVRPEWLLVTDRGVGL